MAEKEEIPGIIPANEWVPELEKDVDYYFSIADKPSIIYTKRYTPNKYPEKFSTRNEELEYQMEEIRRIIHGYDGLCGKGYGFLNYAKLRDPDKGKISPEFRAKQEEYFKKIEELQTVKKGTGLVGFKRRRFGFTSVGAWDDYHDCITKPFYMIGGNSKSENDSRKMFKHVKFIHQNVPEWLRPRATASDRRDFMEFAWYDKDENGNRVKEGIQSWISVVAPVPQNHEGEAYSKMRVDEAGKIECLLEIFALGEDCLMLNTKRIGPFIALGTVGDITKEGAGLMELYKNHKAYGLDQFAVYGYHGLIPDQFGNDMIREAIRWIIYERHARRSATKKVREAFIQKYPLCEKDAFNQVSSGGVGNIQLINNQVIKLISEPPLHRTGWMRRNPGGGVDFVPNDQGKIICYELPEPRKDGYVAGSDPADHDAVKKTRDSSELALAIAAKPFGVEPPKLVLEYCDRPEKLDSFFEQSAMALQWYHNTKVLIEDNRARMVNYFEANYPDLLPLVPKSIGTAKIGFEMKRSIKMTEDRKQQGMGLMEDFIDKYSGFIPSVKLLEQHKVLGDDHADDDLAIAWMLCLIMLQASKKPVSALEEMNKQPAPLYVNKGGLIIMQNRQGQQISRPQVPKNPLFYKSY